MEMYFTDIPKVGDLSLEHVFYEYEEPVLFVCTDRSGKRYLCSCCRLAENWIVRQVDESALIDMIDNRISLDSMFRFYDNKTLFLSWDGEAMQYSSDVPDKAFPKSGSFLELSKDKTDSYRDYLKKQVQAAGTRIFLNSLLEFSIDPVNCEQYTDPLQYPLDLTGTSQLGKQLFFNYKNGAAEKIVESVRLSVEVQNVNGEDSWLAAA